jgi:hypothetical protein
MTNTFFDLPLSSGTRFGLDHIGVDGAHLLLPKEG